MNLSLLRVFSSLRLTVVLLALSMMLVFMATLAQTRLGIWEVMSRYIRTFVVWVPVGGRELPVFPGGWLLGGLLLVEFDCRACQPLHLVLEKSAADHNPCRARCVASQRADHRAVRARNANDARRRRSRASTAKRRGRRNS